MTKAGKELFNQSNRLDSDAEQIYVSQDDDGNGWAEVDGEIVPICDVLAPDNEVDDDSTSDDESGKTSQSTQRPTRRPRVESRRRPSCRGEQLTIGGLATIAVDYPAAPVAPLAVKPADKPSSQPDVADKPLNDTLRSLQRQANERKQVLGRIRTLKEAFVANMRTTDNSRAVLMARYVQLNQIVGELTNIHDTMLRDNPGLEEEVRRYDSDIDRASDGGYNAPEPSQRVSDYQDLNNLMYDATHARDRLGFHFNNGTDK